MSTATVTSWRTGSPSAAGPPQLGPLDGDGPLELVGAGGERLGQLVVEGAQLGTHADRSAGVAVQRRPEGDDRPVGRGFAAEQPQAGDPHRSGLGEPYRPPDATGVPCGIEAIRVLEDAGEVALGGLGAFGSTGRLHRQHVLEPVAELFGDLERVGHEVALGIAEIAAVEPHVALVEEAVEGQPAPAALAGAVGLEPAAVQQRAVAVRERHGRSPVAWHLDRFPGGIVEVHAVVDAAQVVVGDRGAPALAQLHGGGG